MRDLTASTNASNASEEPPDFEAWKDPADLFEGASIKERMLDVIVQVREPTKVSTIADRVDCDVETARNYLNWFTDLGLVRKHTGRPVRYERNESFLRWRRIEQIRTQYADNEIVDELQSVMGEIQEYQDRFGAEAPEHVSLKKAGADSSVADVWEALSEWQTLERRAELLDAARLPPSHGVNSVNA